MLSIYDNKTDGELVFCLYHSAFDSYSGLLLDSFGYDLDNFDDQLSKLKDYTTINQLTIVQNWVRLMNHLWVPVDTSIRNTFRR